MGQASRAKVIEAQKFVLKDTEGNVRGEFSSQGIHPVLTLYSGGPSDHTLELWASGSDSGLSLRGPGGQNVFVTLILNSLVSYPKSGFLTLDRTLTAPKGSTIEIRSEGKVWSAPPR
jgi:hypothetical protein